MAPNEPLEKLAGAGLLKQEPPAGEEIAGLFRTASIRLKDAQKTTNTGEPFRSRVQRRACLRPRRAAHPRLPH